MTLQHPIGYDETGKSGNCSIVAFATLTGIDYKTAEEAAYKAYRRQTKRPVSYERWDGTTYGWPTYEIMADTLGVSLTKHVFRKDVTVATLAKMNAKAKRKAPLVVITRNHATVIKGGMILDQNILSHWSDIKGRKAWRVRQRAVYVVTLNDAGKNMINLLEPGELPA